MNKGNKRKANQARIVIIQGIYHVAEYSMKSSLGEFFLPS